jgi:hypothetical protein
MANRREIVDILLTDYEYDATALLDSLVAALSENDALAALEFVTRVEGWHHRVTADGRIIDAETEKQLYPEVNDAQ